jgi:hypothetical protein
MLVDLRTKDFVPVLAKVGQKNAVKAKSGGKKL